MAEHQTVIVTGATGTGKSYFACALAHQACRKGFRVLYRRVPRLFDELRLARADGTHPRLLARIAKVDVLVLDDFAIGPLTEDARRDLLEILEDRYGLRATIITSQLKHERWHDFLADPTVADAICDRVLHGAHKIALAGPSRRKPKEAATTTGLNAGANARYPEPRTAQNPKAPLVNDYNPDPKRDVASLRSRCAETRDRDAAKRVIAMRRNG